MAVAIADPVRRHILTMLREEPLSAGDIAHRFTISRPAISRHLRVLRESGLVRDDLVGRKRIYRLDPGPLARCSTGSPGSPPATGGSGTSTRWRPRSIAPAESAAAAARRSTEGAHGMTRTPAGRLFRTATGHDLVLTRTFRAPAADVWASLTESERTARWYGPWEGDAAPDGPSGSRWRTRRSSPGPRCASTRANHSGTWRCR
ncbi:metalloregulator ArsR/SmtB family transcription factor [Micromonospora sp. M12]